MLPCPSRRTLFACPDGVPGRQPEVGMSRGVFGLLQTVWRDIGLRKVSHRIAAGLEEQEYVFTVGDPVFAEAHPHAAP
jgi:hypothetical protein